MALAIPVTLGWEPVPVLLLFGALVGSAQHGIGHRDPREHSRLSPTRRP
jgi:hypothetical protein